MILVKGVRWSRVESPLLQGIKKCSSGWRQVLYYYYLTPDWFPGFHIPILDIYLSSWLLPASDMKYSGAGREDGRTELLLLPVCNVCVDMLCCGGDTLGGGDTVKGCFAVVIKRSEMNDGNCSNLFDIYHQPSHLSVRTFALATSTRSCT